jgi:hypothetical protein
MCVGQSEDVLSLQLHPLQHALDRGERLRFLHRAFVTVVNEVRPAPWAQPCCLWRRAVAATGTLRVARAARRDGSRGRGGWGGGRGGGRGGQVGVDINLAVDRQPIHGNTLQFVSGLGPRKAGELLQVMPAPLSCAAPRSRPHHAPPKGGAGLLTGETARQAEAREPRVDGRRAHESFSAHAHAPARGKE